VSVLAFHAETTRPLEVLLDNRSDPAFRAVLADYCLERGERPGRLGVELWAAAAARATAATDADASDAAPAADAPAAAADATAEADATAAAAADAPAADADDADADADADDARGLKFWNAVLNVEEENMTEGLTIVQTFVRYGYAITRVGWLRRDRGDEWSLHDARTMLRREGVAWAPNGLDMAAARGPGERYSLTDPSPLPIEYHRLTLPPTRPCDELAWVKDCPRPEGWQKSTEAA
jgi:hypothetical protein